MVSQWVVDVGQDEMVCEVLLILLVKHIECSMHVDSSSLVSIF